MLGRWIHFFLFFFKLFKLNPSQTETVKQHTQRRWRRIRSVCRFSCWYFQRLRSPAAGAPSSVTACQFLSTESPPRLVLAACRCLEATGLECRAGWSSRKRSVRCKQLSQQETHWEETASLKPVQGGSPVPRSVVLVPFPRPSTPSQVLGEE